MFARLLLLARKLKSENPTACSGYSLASAEIVGLCGAWVCFLSQDGFTTADGERYSGDRLATEVLQVTLFPIETSEKERGSTEYKNQEGQASTLTCI